MIHYDSLVSTKNGLLKAHKVHVGNYMDSPEGWAYIDFISDSKSRYFRRLTVNNTTTIIGPYLKFFINGKKISARGIKKGMILDGKYEDLEVESIITVKVNDKKYPPLNFRIFSVMCLRREYYLPSGILTTI